MTGSLPRKLILLFLLCIVTAVTLTAIYHNNLMGVTAPSYVGFRVCGKCHAADAIGNQEAIWLKTPHANSYDVLKTESARTIAQKKGIDTPWKSLACLKCHTTGGGKFKETSREGVGCEACHGPGSNYFEFSNHASFDNRKGAYMKAILLGMKPILGIDGIRRREKLCRFCHNDERPCVPEDRAMKRKKQLPLSLIADFVFKHPVRR